MLNLEELERPCSNCNSTGKVKSKRYVLVDVKCTVCNGIGMELTCEGIDLISFIKRHFSNFENNIWKIK